MWSRHNVRTAFALAAAVLSGASVTGCGFAPVYGERSESGSVKSALAGVRVEAPESRSGQLFRHRLLELLTGDRVQPEHPAYALKVTLDKEVFPIHVLQNRKVTRFRMHVRSKYELIRLSDGAVLDSGELINSGGYDRVESDYATYVSGRAVGERGMLSLADDYRQLLVNYFLTPEAARPAPRAAGTTAAGAAQTPSPLTPPPAAGAQPAQADVPAQAQAGRTENAPANETTAPPAPETSPSVYAPPSETPATGAFPKTGALDDGGAVVAPPPAETPAPAATFSADLVAPPPAVQDAPAPVVQGEAPPAAETPPPSPEEKAGDIGAHLGPDGRAPE